MKKLFCKIFGHSWDDAELALYNIEIAAINARSLKPEISCKRRCGHKVKYSFEVLVD